MITSAARASDATRPNVITRVWRESDAARGLSTNPEEFDSRLFDHKVINSDLSSRQRQVSASVKRVWTQTATEWRFNINSDYIRYIIIMENIIITNK